MNKIHCPELDKLFDWERFYIINPKDIKWVLSTLTGFNVVKNEWHKVYDGDWDKKEYIENDFVHYSVMQMLKEQKPFIETDLYCSSVNKILKGEPRWGCRTVEEFKKRGEHIIKIYNKIKKEGFKTQKELNSKQEYNFKINGKFVDDPGIVIDRDGRYLYHNGNHRLAIFKILNTPKINININVRHKQWVEFLQYVKNISTKLWGEGKIYQPVDHFDFMEYKPEWGDYRFNIIKKHINKDLKTVLDIGALWGYFSSKLEEEGFNCTAVENNAEFIYIMKKLRTSKDQTFKVFDKNLFSLQEYNFDVVLALNIFHHFLKKETSFNYLTQLLKKLNMKEMYFQAHQTEEYQMKEAYVNFNYKEFVDYIINNSCLNQAIEIGEEKGRKLFKIWK